MPSGRRLTGKTLVARQEFSFQRPSPWPALHIRRARNARAIELPSASAISSNSRSSIGSVNGVAEEPLVLQWLGDAQSLRTRLLAAGWQEAVPWTKASAARFLDPAAPLDRLPGSSGARGR